MQVFLELGDAYPSMLSFDYNGVLTWASWNNHKGFHRKNNLPAVIKYDNKIVSRVGWYVNGEPYRENDLPTDVFYHYNGILRLEEWDNNSVYHRVTGPCLITYDDNGKLENEKYYLNDKEMDKIVWLKNPCVKRILKNKGNGVLVSDVSL